MDSDWRFDINRGLRYRYDEYNAEYVYEDNSRVASQRFNNGFYDTSSRQYAHSTPHSGYQSPAMPCWPPRTSFGDLYGSPPSKGDNRSTVLNQWPVPSAPAFLDSTTALSDQASSETMAQTQQKQAIEHAHERESMALMDHEHPHSKQRISNQMFMQGKEATASAQVETQQLSTPQVPQAGAHHRSKQMILLMHANTDRHYPLLDRNYRRCSQPKDFFTVGRVFCTLWTEPAQDSNKSAASGQAWCLNKYGELIYTKVRRFIVIREDESAFLAVPVTTYNGQGVAKRDVKKSDHCIVYSGNVEKVPVPAPREVPSRDRPEAPMQPFPVHVETEKGQKLDPLSRINFAKPQTMEHYVKVKNVGKVSPGSMYNFRYQFRNVFENGSST